MTTVYLCESRRERKGDAIEWVLFATTALKTLQIVDVRIDNFLEKKMTIIYLLKSKPFEASIIYFYKSSPQMTHFANGVLLNLFLVTNISLL